MGECGGGSPTHTEHTNIGAFSPSGISDIPIRDKRMICVEIKKKSVCGVSGCGLDPFLQFVLGVKGVGWGGVGAVF